MSENTKNSPPTNDLILFPLDIAVSKPAASIPKNSKSTTSQGGSSIRPRTQSQTQPVYKPQPPQPLQPQPPPPPLPAPKRKSHRFIGIVGFLVLIYFSYDYVYQNLVSQSSKNEATLNLNEYVIVTNSVDLNVRESPSTTARIIQTLQKNSKTYGRPSSNEDWIEITTAEGNKIGFASSKYLEPITKTEANQELSPAERLEKEYFDKINQLNSNGDKTGNDLSANAQDLNMDSEYHEVDQAEDQSVDSILDSEIFLIVDEDPELIGGLQGLQRRIVYPEFARRAGIEGRVIVEFIVDEYGNVLDPIVRRGIGGGCDEVALEAVRNAKFIPGKHQGRAVKVQYSLPINFYL